MIDERKLAGMLREASQSAEDWRDALTELAEWLEDAAQPESAERWSGWLDWQGGECPLPFGVSVNADGKGGKFGYMAICASETVRWDFVTRFQYRTGSDGWLPIPRGWRPPESAFKSVRYEFRYAVNESHGVHATHIRLLPRDKAAEPSDERQRAMLRDKFVPPLTSDELDIMRAARLVAGEKVEPALYWFGPFEWEGGDLAPVPPTVVVEKQGSDSPAFTGQARDLDWSYPARLSYAADNPEGWIERPEGWVPPDEAWPLAGKTASGDTHTWYYRRAPAQRSLDEMGITHIRLLPRAQQPARPELPAIVRKALERLGRICAFTTARNAPERHEMTRNGQDAAAK